MPMQAREIKERLKSIKNTQKITRTMELVSAAKMRRAISSAMDSRPYASLAWSIAQRLRQNNGDSTDPIYRFFDPIQPDKATHTTILLLTSNRGLCGAFNSHVIKQVVRYIETNPNETVDVIGVGKKGVSTLKAFGKSVELAYEKDDSARTDDSIRDIALYAHTKFNDGKTDKVLLAYTDFKSPIVQTAVLKQLFPFPLEAAIEEAIDNVEEPKEAIEQAAQDLEYTYEPSEREVLEHLVPRIAISELYQALLESNASEHSSRMLAMKNASDAAGEMKNELTLAFNRARQAGITQEIAEISAGSAAVS